MTDLAAGEIVRVRSRQYLINLSPEIAERWKATKNVLNQGVDSIANSKQQFSESLKATASKQTGEVVDTVINTFQKVKDSVDETLQSAEQIKNTTSSALQTVVTDSVNNWLTQHPGFLRFLHLLGWAGSHPILTIVILLFAIALIWSIIKVIVRLIETASWSLLQIPVKLIWSVIKVSFVSLTKFTGFAFQSVRDSKLDNTVKNLPINSETFDNNKHQRLAQISKRLEVIQAEQQQLLAEAADLMAGENIDHSTIHSALAITEE
ncbi:hypothetical protein NWP22_09030 [Anabaenopsis tanganyikae CS-531]|uniref:Uncharacterized protein n=1 Tax=Anabaenopsis tanganyikae CS-531 TaxID=2785304 RepID=A0ABT6KF79_9CYAN|nr:hypothetical protein [Anabaenopsis tanganyikae]MDH6106004.1 hypothetical protein [Anabaenopsis tanganyikae CS-531]